MEANTQPTVRSYQDLRVFQGAMDACIEVSSISKKFPPEERFTLTDQVRRSSRSVFSLLPCSPVSLSLSIRGRMVIEVLP
ncbi:MAG: four helix bundle protein [Acidobacteriota bacterium]